MQVSFSFKLNSLKTILTSIVILIIILLTFTLTIVSYYTAYDSIKIAYINQMRNFNEEYNRELETIYQTNKNLLIYLSKNEQIAIALESKDFSSVTKRLESIYKDFGGFENVFISTAEEDSRILTDGIGGKSVGLKWGRIPAYNENAINNLEGKVHISNPAVSPVTGLPVVLMSAPIFDKDKKVIGIYGLPIDLYSYSMSITSNLTIGKTGYPFITDNNGIVIAHPDKKKVLTDFKKYDFGKKVLSSPEGSIVEYKFEGKDKILTFKRNEKYGIVSAITLYTSDISEQTNNLASIMIILGVLVLLVSSIFINYIMHKRLKPLLLAKDYLINISKGKLKRTEISKKIGLTNLNDEIGEMLKAVEELSNKLVEILKKVIESINELSESAIQIDKASQDLSNGASEQAASVEQTTTSLEEITATVVQNADNATLTSQQANQSVSKLQNSGKAVRETLDVMKQISKKITVIEEIASQTNLLSVNAAIEAAKAGEQGQGFAVVAMEVRKLSDNSHKASGEILELANDSIGVAQKSGDLMEEVVPEIQKVTDLINEIASASNEQKIGLEQVNQGMNQLSTVAQQNASSSEELAATSTLLRNNVQKVKDAISYFEL